MFHDEFWQILVWPDRRRIVGYDIFINHGSGYEFAIRHIVQCDKFYLLVVVAYRRVRHLRCSFLPGKVGFLSGDRYILFSWIINPNLSQRKLGCLSQDQESKCRPPDIEWGYLLQLWRLFSTRRDFPRGAEFSFVFSHSTAPKTKKNSAPRGKCRLVENSLLSWAQSSETKENSAPRGKFRLVENNFKVDKLAPYFSIYVYSLIVKAGIGEIIILFERSALYVISVTWAVIELALGIGYRPS